MKKYFFIILMVSVAACSRTPEEIFQDAVVDYNAEKDPEARVILDQAYLEECGAVVIDSADTYLPGNNSIILKNNSITTVITSDGYREPWSDDIRFSFYDPTTKKLCTSDGFRAEFFQFSRDENGDQLIARLESVELADDDEVSIDALYLYNNLLYYFYKRQLYSLDPVTYETKKIFEKITFSPPFTKEKFKVTIEIAGDVLAVVVGNAGAYNLSLLSLSKEKKITLNKKVASSFVVLQKDRLLYIGGKTGAWSLKSRSITTEEEQTVKEFDTLKDISISGNNIFYVDSEGFHITDIAFEKTYTENNLYAIKRLIRDSILVAQGKKLYLVETQKYFAVTNKFEKLIPSFFEDEVLEIEK